MLTSSSALAYIIVLSGLALAVAYAFSSYTYEVQGGLLVFFVLFLFGLCLVRWMARTEGSRWLLYLLVSALVLKLAFAVIRMQVNFVFYGDQYDAGRYYNTGTVIAEKLWDLNFAAVVPYVQFQGSWGTIFTEFYTGLVRTLVGPTLSGTFLVFGILAFIGSFFYYRAFCVAFPQGDRRLYAVMAFLMPSILLWPNGIGKDALMALFIGLSAYGSARCLKGEYVKGLLPLGVGLFAAFTVRPHITGILMVALVVAFSLGSRRLLSGMPIAYVIVIPALIAAAWLVVPMAASYAGLPELSQEALEDYVELRQRQTLSGGSAFTPPSINDPSSVPMILATILVRPFPWEAHNVQAYAQTLNGVLLIGLIVWKIRRVGQAVLTSLSSPYIIFILAYLVLFGLSFVTISNFGTLARMQAMLLPLFLMLLAYRPVLERTATDSVKDVDQEPNQLLSSKRPVSPMNKYRAGFGTRT